MSTRLSIRIARQEDLEELRQALASWSGSDAPAPGSLRDMVSDGCLLLGRARGQLVAINGIDLDCHAMRLTTVAPAWRRQGLGRRMVVAAERLAVQFGLFRLSLDGREANPSFFRACGYLPAEKAHTGTLTRRFTRRQTRFGRQVREVLERLGIESAYGVQHRLRLQPESCRLVDAGEDVLGRRQALDEGTWHAWTAMRDAARQEGVVLQIASAFRSVRYQQDLVSAKLEAGHAMPDILRVSAAPGFSEHHSGRAIDIATPESKPMETEFEDTDAFAWLRANGPRHRFRLSYPRGNRHGMAYEPWHWFFTG